MHFSFGFSSLKQHCQNPLHAEMCLQIGSDGKKEKKKGQREGQEEKKTGSQNICSGATS